MSGLNVPRAARDEGDVPLPDFAGPPGRPAIGIGADGFGSEALLQALREDGRYRAGMVERLAMAALTECDALVLTQRRRPASLTKKNCWLIWDWVEGGGRLALTHDAVGYRDHPVLFPWVCSGGTAHVNRQGVKVVWAPERQAPLGEITHAYPDHILLRPCLRARVTVIAVDAATGEPVVSGAAFERGRVLACGLAIGVAPDGTDAPPQGGERDLLNVMLEWLLA